MRFTEEHKALLKTVQEFVENEIRPYLDECDEA
jgi:Fe-S cluster biogenesis protein NfuA